MKIIFLLLFIPMSVHAQKKSFGNAYIGGQFVSMGLGNDDRGGLALGFGYGMDKHFLIGATFDGFIFSDSKPKYGAARADLSYFINGLTKKGTAFFSFQPGLTIYNKNQYNGNLAIDGLVGAKLKINKSAAFFIMAGYSMVSIRLNRQNLQKYEGFKLKLAIGI